MKGGGGVRRRGGEGVTSFVAMTTVEETPFLGV